MRKFYLSSTSSRAKWFSFFSFPFGWRKLKRDSEFPERSALPWPTRDSRSSTSSSFSCCWLRHLFVGLEGLSFTTGGPSGELSGTSSRSWMSLFLMVDREELVPEISLSTSGLTFRNEHGNGAHLYIVHFPLRPHSLSCSFWRRKKKLRRNIILPEFSFFPIFSFGIREVYCCLSNISFSNNYYYQPNGCEKEIETQEYISRKYLKKNINFREILSCFSMISFSVLLSIWLHSNLGWPSRDEQNSEATIYVPEISDSLVASRILFPSPSTGPS